MHKSPKDWSAVIPEMVTSGSVAQATNVLTMALQDIAELAKALRQQQAWVRHWRDDKAHGLKPTDGSLDDANDGIEAVLEKAGAAMSTYRDFIISFNPPPIPVRDCDWHAVHKDYDGTEDGNDHRYFHSRSEADCKAQIDDWHAEQAEVIYELFIGAALMASSMDRDWTVNEALPFHRRMRRSGAATLVTRDKEGAYIGTEILAGA